MFWDKYFLKIYLISPLCLSITVTIYFTSKGASHTWQKADDVGISERFLIVQKSIV